MKACGDPRRTGAARGVADHFPLAPRPGEMLPSAPGGIPVNGDAAGCADLPPVGVAAEMEIVAVVGGLSVGLRRVGEEDGDLAFGNPGACRDQIVGPEEVGVVDPADPDPRSLALDRGGLIEEDRKSRILKRSDLFKKVMVSKNGEPERMQGRHEPDHLLKGMVNGSSHIVVVVPRQDDGIVRGVGHRFADPLHHAGIEVAVEVGEMEQAEPLERLR